MIRKTADTELPMMPPTNEKVSKRSEIAAAEAATRIEVMMTMLL
jgi:hypothetical protein